jgi:phosphoserine phosphatase
MKKIAFFDLDGTVLRGISSEKAFFFYLLRKRYIGPKQFFCYWAFILRWFPKYKFLTFIKNKAYLTGLSKDEITKLAEKFVVENLLKKLRPDLMVRIEEHMKAKDLVVLLTGAPAFLAKVFAKHLGIDEVQPTRCVHLYDKFSHLPPTQNPFAKEKLEIAEKLCGQHEVNIKDCAAYGNSIYDATLLKAVGQAVAVTPDRRLRKVAKKHGWEIVD